MPTSSFEEEMVIDTSEAAQGLLEAFKEAEIRGPYVPKRDIIRLMDEQEKNIKNLKL